jgi:hypothetical protein
MKLLEFLTGFFNAATILPLFVVLPVMLWAAFTRKGKRRDGQESSYLAGLITGLTTLMLALAGLYWWNHPNLHFTVETITTAHGQPEFQSGEIHPEDRAGLIFRLRAETWRPINRVIVDERPEHFRTAYAFVGRHQGTVYTCRPSSLHRWEITSTSPWSGDPRKFIEQAPLP